MNKKLLKLKRIAEIVEPEFSKEVEQGFRDFLNFVKDKLTKETSNGKDNN